MRSEHSIISQHAGNATSGEYQHAGTDTSNSSSNNRFRSSHTTDPATESTANKDNTDARTMNKASAAALAYTLSHTLSTHGIYAQEVPIGRPCSALERTEHGRCRPPTTPTHPRTVEQQPDPPSQSHSESEPCPQGMVYIPSGRFWMGSMQGEGADDERPRRRVELSSYCIDRTEVTVSSYAECVNAGHCPPALSTAYDFRLMVPDQVFWSQFCNAERHGTEQHPINCIDSQYASGYCRWRGGTLPTEAQWEYAARGPQGNRYPWGSTPSPGPTLLNALGLDNLRAFTQPGRTYDPPMYEANDGHTSTSPVASFPGGASPFGLHDMAGNVAEWVLDGYARYSSTATSNPTAPRHLSHSEQVIRGGAWDTGHPNLVRSSSRNWAMGSARLPTVGFRCVHPAVTLGRDRNRQHPTNE